MKFLVDYQGVCMITNSLLNLGAPTRNKEIRSCFRRRHIKIWVLSETIMLLGGMKRNLEFE